MTEVCTCRTIALSGWDTVQQAVDPACPLHATTSLDPAYCADGCGRLAETERPTADGRREDVCAGCGGTCGCLLGSIHTRADHAEWAGSRTLESYGARTPPAGTVRPLGFSAYSDHATLEDR